MPLLQSLFRAVLMMGCFIFTLHSDAQDRVNIITSSPIQVVGSDDLERTITIGNIQEILRYTPDHVLKERTSIDLKNPDRTTLVLTNSQRLPTYARLNGSPDLNVIPISKIERVEIMRDGATSLYGSDAITGVTNFIIRSSAGMDGFQNDYETGWAATIADILGKPASSLTLDDNTYKNGKLTLNLVPEGNFIFETRTYFDDEGKLRIKINRQYTQEGTMFEIKDYFDCSGSQVHKQAYYTEPFGYTFPMFDIPYINGQAQTGYRDIAPGNAFKPYRQPYNPDTKSIDWSIGPGEWQGHQFIVPEPCSENDDPDDDDAEYYNMFFLGLSYLMEDTDGMDPFGMIGPGLNYTRMVTPKLGVGIDAAYYTGDQNGLDVSRTNIMVGVEYFPFGCMGPFDRFSASPFVYAGISGHKQKYMNFKNSLTSLSALAGLNLSAEITPKIRGKISAAVNPVFIENNTALNGRFDFGIRYHF